MFVQTDSNYIQPLHYYRSPQHIQMKRTPTNALSPNTSIAAKIPLSTSQKMTISLIRSGIR